MFFEDYVSFTDILTSDDIEAKANYSFRMLDYNEKGYIDEDDVYLMMSALFELFSILTGHKIYLMPDYTRKVYRELDYNIDGRIQYEEYKQLYAKSRKVFPWFEWFNQDDLFAKEVFARHESEGFPGSPNITGEDIKGDLGKTVDIVHKQRSSNSGGISPTLRYSIATTGGGGTPREDPRIVAQGNFNPLLQPLDSPTTPDWRQKYKAGKSALKTFDTPKSEPIRDDSVIRPQYGNNFIPQIQLLSPPAKKKSRWDFLRRNKKSDQVSQVNSVNAAYSKSNELSLVSIANPHPMLSTNPMCYALMDDDERRESFPEEFETDSDSSNENDLDLAPIQYQPYIGTFNAQRNMNPYSAWVIPGEQCYAHGQYLERRETALMSSTLRKQANPKLNGRNVGLFFGHENWATILNLMIGFRTGLKM